MNKQEEDELKFYHGMKQCSPHSASACGRCMSFHGPWCKYAEKVDGEWIIPGLQREALG
jgi:hypothetical protein